MISSRPLIGPPPPAPTLSLKGPYKVLGNPWKVPESHQKGLREAPQSPKKFLRKSEGIPQNVLRKSSESPEKVLIKILR